MLRLGSLTPSKNLINKLLHSINITFSPYTQGNKKEKNKQDCY